MKIGVPFFWQAPGTLLVEIGGVEEVVRDVVQQDVELSGLEGFKIDPMIWPQLDQIASIDSLSNMERILEVARNWNKDAWVDITLSGPK